MTLFNQTKILYVFWDSDNTLVNTAEHHWRKHFETLKTLGIDLDEKFRKRVYENNGKQNYAWIKQELGLDLTEEEYLEKIDSWYFDHIGDVEIREGVLEAIDFFNNHNIPQAVVSNGRRNSVLPALKAKELDQYFKFILCKEDYEGRKPEPTPYLTALTKMQKIMDEAMPPENCLVIEDDPLGVQAGEAAGMAVLYRPIGDTTSIKALVS
ncbi:MAG: HAD family phosphatase [Pseudomonadota bacterium]